MVCIAFYTALDTIPGNNVEAAQFVRDIKNRDKTANGCGIRTPSTTTGGT
jgi:hypothetical protein